MPLLNPIRSQAQRAKAAADRKRQRENVKLKEENKPVIKTPRQLEIERREAAGEVVRRGSKFSSGKRKKWVKIADGLGREQGDEYSDEGSDDDAESAVRRRRKIGNYQRQPTGDDASRMEFVIRNGSDVPRLTSTVELSPELLDEQNGVELAKTLEKQSNSTLLEIFSKLQDNGSTAWERVKTIVNALAEGEEHDKYTRHRFCKDQSSTLPEDDAMILDECDRDSSPDADVDNLDRTEIDAPDSMKSKRDAVTEIKVANDAYETEINTNDFADAIMRDLMKAWTVQEGQRAARLSRELYNSKSIQRDRTERFEHLHNSKLQRKRQVLKQRAAFRPQGIRSPAAVRTAFDIISSQIKGPKSFWKDSAEWFMATLDVINSEHKLCLALFQPKTGYFLEDLKTAMQMADEQHYLTLLEQRSEEEYADLIGAEPRTAFEDCFLLFEQ